MTLELPPFNLDAKTISRLRRNRDMWRAWLAGENIVPIAKRFGLTRWRVSYLIRRTSRRLRYILDPNWEKVDWGSTGVDYPDRRRALETALVVDGMVFVFGPGNLLEDVYVDGMENNAARRRLKWEWNEEDWG